MPLAPGQQGRVYENLVENSYTVGSDGRLQTWLPVLDSRGVDRALALDSGPPLFLQVKSHERRRQDNRLSFAIPLSQVGTYTRWVVALMDATTGGYLMPGAALLRLGTRGRLVDGRPCIRVTASRASPRWGPYWTPMWDFGRSLIQLAAPGLRAAPLEVLPERSQEEGAYFEAAITAALLGATDRLVLYRPAVDFAGRDLLLQLSGSASSLYLQVKGTFTLDLPDHVRFQVRRRTFSPDPHLRFVFCYRAPDAPLGPVWLVPAAELLARCHPGDEEHLSFEARVTGSDERWSEFRLAPEALAAGLVAELQG